MSSETPPPSDDSKKKGKGKNQQVNKCINEKRRREEENVYIEELAQLIAHGEPKFSQQQQQQQQQLDHQPSQQSQQLTSAIKPDKCAILQLAVGSMQQINREDGSGLERMGVLGGELEGEGGATGSDGVQQSQVSSSKPSPSMLDSEVIGPLLLEALDGFLFMVNRDGTIKFMSENVSQYLHFVPEELMGKNVYSLIHRSSRDKFESLLDSLTDVSSSTSLSSSSSDDGSPPILRLPGGSSSQQCPSNRVQFECLMLLKTEYGERNNEAGVECEPSTSPTSSKYENMQIVAVCQQCRDSDVDGTNQPFLACLARRIGFTEKNLSPVLFEQFTTKQDLNGKILGCQTSSSLQNEQFFIEKNILEFCHVNDKDRLYHHHEEVLTNGSNTSGVYRFQVAKNRFVFVQTKSKLFKNPTCGKPEFIMSTHSIVRECDTESELNDTCHTTLLSAIIGQAGLTGREMLGSGSGLLSCMPRRSANNIDASPARMRDSRDVSSIQQQRTCYSRGSSTGSIVGICDTGSNDAFFNDTTPGNILPSINGGSSGGRAGSSLSFEQKFSASRQMSVDMDLSGSAFGGGRGRSKKRSVSQALSRASPAAQRSPGFAIPSSSPGNPGSLGGIFPGSSRSGIPPASPAGSLNGGSSSRFVSPSPTPGSLMTSFGMVGLTDLLDAGGDLSLDEGKLSRPSTAASDGGGSAAYRRASTGPNGGSLGGLSRASSQGQLLADEFGDVSGLFLDNSSGGDVLMAQPTLTPLERLQKHTQRLGMETTFRPDLVNFERSRRKHPSNSSSASGSSQAASSSGARLRTPGSVSSMSGTPQPARKPAQANQRLGLKDLLLEDDDSNSEAATPLSSNASHNIFGRGSHQSVQTPGPNATPDSASSVFGSALGGFGPPVLEAQENLRPGVVGRRGSRGSNNLLRELLSVTDEDDDGTRRQTGTGTDRQISTDTGGVVNIKRERIESTGDNAEAGNSTDERARRRSQLLGLRGIFSGRTGASATSVVSSQADTSNEMLGGGLAGLGGRTFDDLLRDLDGGRNEAEPSQCNTTSGGGRKNNLLRELLNSAETDSVDLGGSLATSSSSSTAVTASSGSNGNTGAAATAAGNNPGRRTELLKKLLSACDSPKAADDSPPRVESTSNNEPEMASADGAATPETSAEAVAGTSSGNTGAGSAGVTSARSRQQQLQQQFQQLRDVDRASLVSQLIEKAKSGEDGHLSLILKTLWDKIPVTGEASPPSTTAVGAESGGPDAKRRRISTASSSAVGSDEHVDSTDSDNQDGQLRRKISAARSSSSSSSNQNKGRSAAKNELLLKLLSSNDSGAVPVSTVSASLLTDGAAKSIATITPQTGLKNSSGLGGGGSIKPPLRPEQGKDDLRVRKRREELGLGARSARSGSQTGLLEGLLEGGSGGMDGGAGDFSLLDGLDLSGEALSNVDLMIDAGIFNDDSLVHSDLLVCARLLPYPHQLCSIHSGLLENVEDNVDNMESLMGDHKPVTDSLADNVMDFESGLTSAIMTSELTIKDLDSILEMGDLSGTFQADGDDGDLFGGIIDSADGSVTIEDPLVIDAIQQQLMEIEKGQGGGRRDSMASLFKSLRRGSISEGRRGEAQPSHQELKLTTNEESQKLYASLRHFISNGVGSMGAPRRQGSVAASSAAGSAQNSAAENSAWQQQQQPNSQEGRLGGVFRGSGAANNLGDMMNVTFSPNVVAPSSGSMSSAQSRMMGGGGANGLAWTNQQRVATSRAIMAGGSLTSQSGTLSTTSSILSGALRGEIVPSSRGVVMSRVGQGSEPTTPRGTTPAGFDGGVKIPPGGPRSVAAADQRGSVSGASGGVFSPQDGGSAAAGRDVRTPGGLKILQQQQQQQQELLQQRRQLSAGTPSSSSSRIYSSSGQNLLPGSNFSPASSTGAYLGENSAPSPSAIHPTLLGGSGLSSSFGGLPIDVQRNRGDMASSVYRGATSAMSAGPGSVGNTAASFDSEMGGDMLMSPTGGVAKDLLGSTGGGAGMLGNQPTTKQQPSTERQNSSGSGGLSSERLSGGDMLMVNTDLHRLRSPTSNPTQQDVKQMLKANINSKRSAGLPQTPIGSPRGVSSSNTSTGRMMHSSGSSSGLDYNDPIADNPGLAQMNRTGNLSNYTPQQQQQLLLQKRQLQQQQQQQQQRLQQQQQQQQMGYGLLGDGLMDERRLMYGDQQQRSAAMRTDLQQSEQLLRQQQMQQFQQPQLNNNLLRQQQQQTAAMRQDQLFNNMDYQRQQRQLAQLQQPAMLQHNNPSSSGGFTPAQLQQQQLLRQQQRQINLQQQMMERQQKQVMQQQGDSFGSAAMLNPAQQQQMGMSRNSLLHQQSNNTMQQQQQQLSGGSLGAGSQLLIPGQQFNSSVVGGQLFNSAAMSGNQQYNGQHFNNPSAAGQQFISDTQQFNQSAGQQFNQSAGQQFSNQSTAAGQQFSNQSAASQQFNNKFNNNTLDGLLDLPADLSLDDTATDDEMLRSLSQLLAGNGMEGLMADLDDFAGGQLCPTPPLAGLSQPNAASGLVFTHQDNMAVSSGNIRGARNQNMHDIGKQQQSGHVGGMGILQQQLQQSGQQHQGSRGGNSMLENLLK